MSAMPTSRIESLAGDVLTETFGNIDNLSLPVNLEKIAVKNNLSIELGHFKDHNVSGAYDKAARKIYVADDESYQRQAITIGHELGHYFLHEDLDNDVMLRKYSLDPGDQKEPREMEANKFAAALLMPPQLVTRYWNTPSNVADIAQIFGVSQTAASWRLHNLGLLD